MVGVLSNEQKEAVLSSQAIGRLVCTDGKQPYISPVTYAYDGKYIYGQTSEGKKLRILRKNPTVCFEVDRMIDLSNWESVIIFGKFEELTGPTAQEARNILVRQVFPLATGSSVHPHQHEVTTTMVTDNRTKPVMYRISIEETTGRYEKG